MSEQVIRPVAADRVVLIGIAVGVGHDPPVAGLVRVQNAGAVTDGIAEYDILQRGFGGKRGRREAGRGRFE